MRIKLTIILMIIAANLFSQSTYDHQGKIRMRYNNGGANDTLLISFSGDTVLYNGNNPFHKFAGGAIMDSIKLNGLWYTEMGGSQWTTTGSDIYYNTGNVGIGTNAPSKKLHILSNSDEQVILDANSGQQFTALNFANNGTPKGYIFYDNTNGSFNIAADESEWLALNPNNSNVGVGFGTTAPSYLLHVNGLIGGRNIETNTTSASTILGIDAGVNETKNALRENVFIGYQSGQYTTAGLNNTFIGSGVGISNITGNNNTYLGSYAGNLATGSNNIFIGYKSGLYETGANKLFIDALDRTDEATARASALMYGIFHASPGNQRLTVNGRFDSDNIETNGTTNSVRLGISSLSNEDETTARYNVALGHQAGGAITTGNSNIMIGTLAGGKTTTSAYNVFIGRQSGYDNITGEKNTYVGYLSGENSTGSSNVFIGHQAGYYETGSSKLFIDNQPRTDEATSRTSSLIYGVFDATPANQSLTINAKLKVDMPHIAIYRNTDLTISAAQNIWYKITGFTSKDADMMTVAGDSIQLTVAGHYIVNVNTSFSGANNEVWELGIFKNNTLEEPSQLRYTSTADVGNMSCPVYVSSDGDDWVSFRIRNTTDNDDPTIKRFSTIISTIHLTK